MKEYIATFFSHFGATRFKKLCDASGFEARVMPVPRDLSSSCGTCVRYRGPGPWPGETVKDEIEQIVELAEKKYVPVYRAEDI